MSNIRNDNLINDAVEQADILDSPYYTNLVAEAITEGDLERLYVLLKEMRLAQDIHRQNTGKHTPVHKRPRKDNTLSVDYGVDNHV